MAFGLGLAYLGIRLAVLAVNLAGSYTSAQVLLESSSAVTLTDLTRTLSDVQSKTSWAASSAEDPGVTALELIPVLGADIHGLRMAAISANDLVMSAQPVLQLATVVQARIDRDEPPLGDPGLVLALRGGVNELVDAAHRAVGNFSSVETGSLHFGLSDKLGKVKKTLEQMDSGLSNVRTSTNLVTTLFESSQKKTWFVATQNLAELRATGGLLGSFAIVQIENGKVKLLKAGADKVLLARGPVDFSEYPEEIRNLWGADLSDWRDFGVSAHVPFTAELIRSGYQKKFGTQVDGVIFLGQGELAKLLGATGAQRIWGQEISSKNAVEFLTKTIYAKYTNVDKKNAFVSGLMANLLTKLSSADLNLKGLLESAVDDKTGDQPAMWSADVEQEEAIQRLGIGGEVSTAPGSDVIISVNNGGGNKLDAYFALAASYAPAKCGVMTADGQHGRESRVTITVTNRAPRTGLPAYVTPRLDLIYGQPYVEGSNRELVTVYAPVGSSDNGMKLDGKEVDFVSGFDREHPVYVFEVLLDPGQTRTLEINFIEPTFDTTGVAVSGRPTLRVTPMISRPEISIARSVLCPRAN